VPVLVRREQTGRAGADDPDRPPGPGPGPEPRPGPADPGPVSHTAGGDASPLPQRSGEPEPDGDPGSRWAVQVGGEQAPRHPDSYAMSEARQPLAVPPGGDRRLRGAAAALRGRPQDSAELPG
jgi:hypothetical protein